MCRDVTTTHTHSDVSMVTMNACCQWARVKHTPRGNDCVQSGSHRNSNAVADPGKKFLNRVADARFPSGGNNNFGGTISNLFFGVIFPRKMKKNLTGKGDGASLAPPRSANKMF